MKSLTAIVQCFILLSSSGCTMADGPRRTLVRQRRLLQPPASMQPEQHGGFKLGSLRMGKGDRRSSRKGKGKGGSSRCRPSGGEGKGEGGGGRIRDRGSSRGNGRISGRRRMGGKRENRVLQQRALGTGRMARRGHGKGGTPTHPGACPPGYVPRYSPVSSKAELQAAIQRWISSDGTDSVFGPTINDWDVSAVADFSFLFEGGETFNEPLGDWETSQATNMASMFRGASLFDQDISGWDVSGVTDFSNMFREASSFNQDISRWSTISALTLSGTFYVAKAFNQNINSWNVASVTDFSSMFQEATSFNQDLSGWSTVSAQNFYGLFCVATAFNQNINSWNVASVTDFSSMFQEATSFNQDISSWTVSSVTTFELMFDDSGFNQNLCDWGASMAAVPITSNVENMFRDTSCPSTAEPNLAASPVSPLCYLCSDTAASTPTTIPTTMPTGFVPRVTNILFGDETQGDCYFVGMYQTQTTNNPNTGCSYYTMTFSYYNGGYYVDQQGELIDTGQPREDYQVVGVEATLECNASPDVCTISVAGMGTCNGCSFSGGLFTLTDCSNLAGIFKTGVDQSYIIHEYGVLPPAYENQFFALEFSQARCDAYPFS